MSIQGEPVAVLASGPSLVTDDIDALRTAGIPLIAVNCTWRVAPDCIALVAGDRRWWKEHHEAAPKSALWITKSAGAGKAYGCRVIKSRASQAYNSGMLAVEWAIRKGASKVIMLGFDVSLKHGLHHHGPHVETPNPDEHRITQWHRHFEALRKAQPDADVVNCSRYTELQTFPCQPLEEVLCLLG